MYSDVAGVVDEDETGHDVIMTTAAAAAFSLLCHTDCDFVTATRIAMHATTVVTGSLFLLLRPSPLERGMNAPKSRIAAYSAFPPIVTASGHLESPLRLL